MKKFELIYAAAAERKGGVQTLESLLSPVATPAQLKQVADDRYLAQMTRCVFNAGFHWRVISAKWPGFEEAFHGFDLAQLLTKSPEEWEAYLEDTRIVRNWQKIQTVFENALMIEAVAQEHGSFAAFFSGYPASDQVGLMKYLKTNGARLGGQTAQWFIRFTGKDGFVTSGDTVTALIANGVEIDPRATAQRDLKKIQEAFNEWHAESGRPYTHISKVLSYTVGDNVPVDVLKTYTGQSLVTNQ